MFAEAAGILPSSHHICEYDRRPAVAWSLVNEVGPPGDGCGCSQKDAQSLVRSIAMNGTFWQPTRNLKTPLSRHLCKLVICSGDRSAVVRVARPLDIQNEEVVLSAHIV